MNGDMRGNNYMISGGRAEFSYVSVPDINYVVYYVIKILLLSMNAMNGWGNGKLLTMS